MNDLTRYDLTDRRKEALARLADDLGASTLAGLPEEALARLADGEIARAAVLDWFDVRRPDDYDPEQHAHDPLVNSLCASDDMLSELAAALTLASLSDETRDEAVDLLPSTEARLARAFLHQIPLVDLRPCDGKAGQWTGCDTCRWQRGEPHEATCGNPEAKVNGGDPGVRVFFRREGRLDGTEARRFWHCEGHVAKEGRGEGC